MSRKSVIGVSLGLLLSVGAAAQQPPYQQPYPPPDGSGQPEAPPPGNAPPAPGYPAPPPGYGAPPPGYGAPPPVAYGTPVYPGQPYVGPDGLTYLNGVPVYYAYGAYLPLVFVAGFGWGYWGPGHHWFGAPLGLRGRLEHFYPGGRGFPYGGHPGPGFHGPGRGFEHR